MRLPRRRTASRWAIAIALSVALLAGLLADGVGSAAGQGPLLRQRSVHPATSSERHRQIAVLDAALTRIEQRISSGSPAWGDLDLRDVFAYRLAPLWQQGIDGYGTAVAVMEGWDYPGMQADLDALDDLVGLPHAQIRTVFPDGPLPARCPHGMVVLGSYGSCTAWQGELRLDVEAVHLMAPYAKIVISATPSDSEITGDASSEVAMPEIVKGMEYLSRHRLADVISVSDGSSETDYSRGAAEVHAQDPGELTAAAAKIPVVNATGDCGAAQNLTTATRQCGTVSSGPASATWADSPYVTAVGGSVAQYSQPCPPCAGTDGFVLDPIEGAGLSELYARPAYQDGIAGISGSAHRSLPDITMNSTDGTSEAAPLFAGVLALATQVRGANLGPINHALYATLARDPARSGLVDVTRGDNSFGAIPGYRAAAGYDVASGWGTVDASKFVPALARTMAHDQTLAQQAAIDLIHLQGTLTLTPSARATSGATLLITSSGFLPGHPVHLAIDGTRLTTVSADTSGNITYAFTPAGKHLAAGTHTLTVTSMLLDQSRRFTVAA